jgi:symplekin
MAQSAAAPAEMIPQLEAARRLVLGDAHIYLQIVPGILPIIGPGAPLEVRRWGADFLAETFASPALGNAQKDELSAVILPNLRGLLEIPGEDAAVVKSVVQTVASVYSLVFRKWYVTQFQITLRRLKALLHRHLPCSLSQRRHGPV